MTSLGRSRTIRCLLFGVLVLAVTSWAQDRAPIIEKIAKAYGVDSFGQIEAMRYTWNLQYGPINLSRSWEWEPKTGKVTFEGKDKDGKPVKVSYVRSQLSSQPDAVKNEVEPGFVNDNYTFLFPLHAYWDKNASIIDQGRYSLPEGGGTAELVAVKYPSESGGYTPGDTWELFIGNDGRAQYWIYHRGGNKKPLLLHTTWGGHKKAGPLVVSTDHRGKADGKPIRVFYSNVAVKVTGSDKWIEAQ
jgi:hypothetical protein